MSDWQDIIAQAQLAEPATFRRLARRARKLLHANGPPSKALPTSVALLGGATLDLFAPQLELALLCRGLAPELSLAPYGSFMQELIDPGSRTAQRCPRFALVVLTPRDVPEWPASTASPVEAERVAERAARQLIGVCEQFHARTGAEVLLTNFHAPPVRALGNVGVRVPGDPHNFVQRLNVKLGDVSGGGVHLVDVASLAARYGVAHWWDARLWYEAKQPFAHDLAPELARTVAALVAAALGASRKCVVLDLDNTLWGGVIGDVGLAGIELGEGSPRGEAFKAFQEYLRALRERGVLLGVCSKNELANARLPFESHPETVLRLSDFAAFRASWGPKSDALLAIAADLELGLDSFVFVDDNPAEREQVRQALPEVAVIELPSDPAEYARALEASRWLEVASVTEEDRARAEQYQIRAEVRSLEQTLDLSDFLASLQMRAVVAPVTDASLTRVTQLINKTNQFNLTTRRLTSGEIAELAADPAVVARSVRLSDRFGDHGLIGVVIARRSGDSVVVEDWVMSCRVLKRGVERLMLNELAAWAEANGAKTLHGRFVPTGRNELVRSLYDELGFTRAAECVAETAYRLDLGGFQPLAHSIQISTETR